MVNPIAPAEYLKFIASVHNRLEIAADYSQQTGLSIQLEPQQLTTIGYDVFGRMQYLQPEAAAAWFKLQQTAKEDGIELGFVSAFRSVAYQTNLIEKQLAAGNSIDTVLCKMAAPGYSEHHSGRAVDCAEVEKETGTLLHESFEGTDGFIWLQQNADRFQFSLSYPRDNPHGVIYEPWHWAFQL